MMRRATIVASATTVLLSAANAQQFVMYTPPGDDTAVERIDPILAPGGVSQHVHQVFGASGLSSNMDYDSLQGSSCTTVGSADFQGNAQDRSVYWHPALYMNASDGSGYVRVPTNGHKLYYLDIGYGEKRSPFEFPAGFRMMSGNPYLRAPGGPAGLVKWTCNSSGGDKVGSSGGFPSDVTQCDGYPYLNAEVEFPHCWNGDDFSASDPTAHMAYPDGDIRGGSCPSSHPIRLPHLFMENFYMVDSVVDKATPNSFVLAQGDNTGYGMHADFYNGWESGALPALLSGCPQPQWGNEDVGTCPSFKSSGSASSCSLPVQYKENVDTPGKFLPGCNPVSDQNPAPIMAIAPLGTSTNNCNAVSGGSNGGSGASASAPAPSSYGGASPSGPGKATSGAATSYATSTYAAGSTAAATTLATSYVSAGGSSPSQSAASKTHKKHGHGHGHKHPQPTWGGWPPAS